MGFPEDMQGGPQFSRSSVEYTFLRHRIRSDDQDYAKRGDKFVLSLVSEKQRDNFEVALRCLEEIGCRRDVLLKCLFRLWRSKATPAEFPLRKELNSLSATCRTVANSIKRLEGIGVSEALRETVPPHPHWREKYSVQSGRHPTICHIWKHALARVESDSLC